MNNEWCNKLRSLLNVDGVTSKFELEKFLGSQDFLELCCEGLSGDQGGNLSIPIDLNDQRFFIDISYCSAKKEAIISVFKTDESYNYYFPLEVYSVINVDTQKRYSYSEYLNLKKSKRIHLLPGNKLIKIAQFLFSPKTFNTTFKIIIGDWQEEHFEALLKKEIWKAHWINLRYTYAFVAVMCQKSPIGDLIEFVRKFAK